jgi:hypothetical protein
MPWPLTAAATAALLASPPGVLTESQLQAVYELGLKARLQALTAAIDLAQMLQQEVASTQVSRWRLVMLTQTQLQGGNGWWVSTRLQALAAATGLGRMLRQVVPSTEAGTLLRGQES